MGRVIVVMIACILVTCNGLDLTLNQEKDPNLGRPRKPCGVLRCTEDINDSLSASQEDQNDSNVVLNKISSMYVLKSVPTISSNATGNRQVRIASVTSTSPRHSRVTNGRKVDGVLEPGRAAITVELLKQGDCDAHFVCQVQGLDTQGRQVVSSVRLVQQKNQVYAASSNPTTSLQLLAAIQQLVLQAVAGLENRMDKGIDDRLKILEDRVKDRIEILADKIEDLQKDLSTGHEEFKSTMEDRLGQLQRDITSRISARGKNRHQR
ncbi:hypothetical protein ElyMa_004682900 [Elysia marginata]|uniref:Uncharacterized protein n=1 Tax=Elysia marginata TaxID=1093978 RepID=A0AAV4I8Q5_9GAST|nr:hypothetical protein ElyMa_004682900 [Elysia marginata]